MRAFALAAIIAATLPAVATSAATHIYTDRTAFEAAITGAVTDPFVEPTSYYPLTEYGSLYPGTTFSISSSNTYLGVTAPRLGDYWDWNSGAVLDTNTGFLTVSVAAGVTAIGLDLGDYYYNPGYMYLNGDFYLTRTKPNFLFFGITSDGPLAPFAISFAGGYGVIDNVTTGIALPFAATIPEPADWALLIAGFGLTGAVLRLATRRRFA